MHWPGDNRPLTHKSSRWNANSLLSSGLLALLVVGYCALVYVTCVAVAMVLIGGTTGEYEAIPWWVTGFAFACIATTLWPTSHWLRHRVDDLVNAQYDNPYAVMSQLNQQLEDATAPDALLPTVAATLAATLNLPYVAIETQLGARLPATTFGTPPRNAEIVSIPLAFRAVELGILHVSARRPHEHLSAGDTRLLVDLARQVGITLHAAQLTGALQASREQLVLAREEERRRIRRDLHDGLGPTLASLRLQLSALRPTVRRDPAAAEVLIDELRTDVRTATAEIRRLVYDLRPPMLDEFGLLGALRNVGLTSDGLTRAIEAPLALPSLPAAIEVAIYRIATEALLNIVRHAEATNCIIRLALDGENLTLTVKDNGCGLSPSYLPGIGHRSMQERADELGGSVTILPAPDGGTCVTAIFPFKGVAGA